MTVHEALVGARNYLQQHGWVPNWGWKRGGSTCLVGAINLTVSSTTHPASFNQTDERFINECAIALGFDNYVQAMRWNDAQLFNAQLFIGSNPVLDRLDKAIAETAPDPVPVAQFQSNHEFEL